jgi:hypothetical protein
MTPVDARPDSGRCGANRGASMSGGVFSERTLSGSRSQRLPFASDALLAWIDRDADSQQWCRCSYINDSASCREYASLTDGNHLDHPVG